VSQKPLPFLLSQELYALKPGIERRAAIHPERFHAHRHEQAQSDDKDPKKPDPEFWTLLARPELLKGTIDGREWRRLILINDAGMGKSYNCRWLLHEWNDPNRDDLAFLIDIGSLKSDVDFIATHLVPKIRTSEIAGHSNLNPEHVKAELDHLRYTAQISLIFDGLDQAQPEHLETLARLIANGGDWANCRVIIAGRPFAVENFLNIFDSPDQPQETAAWEFVQVAEFDEKQQRQVLGRLSDGRDRFDAIPREAKQLLTVPRVLQYIHSLPEASLPDLRTVSDVYWQATGHMLVEALQNANLREEKILRYRALLGAFAFGMYKQTREEKDERQPNIDRVPAKKMVRFRKEIYKNVSRCLKRLENEDYSGKQFIRDCRTLSKLNAAINHGWLDVDQVGKTKSDLLWRNASLQEFFAAYWATCWADPSERPTKVSTGSGDTPPRCPTKRLRPPTKGRPLGKRRWLRSIENVRSVQPNFSIAVGSG
jgi:hypothetical protein